MWFLPVITFRQVIPPLSLYETPFHVAKKRKKDDALMNLEMYSPAGSRKCAD
jgi:hypothetical protein